MTTTEQPISFSTPAPPRTQSSSFTFFQPSPQKEAVCTETLCLPSKEVISSTYLWNMYRIRYLLIRYLTCPVPFLPQKTPVLGGHSLLECIYLVLATVLLVLYCQIDESIKGSGSIAQIAGVSCVLLGYRNNVATIYFGISFERALFWHKVAAILVLVLSAIHTVIGQNGERDKIITGYILLGLMIATSFAYALKRWVFELFYFIHFGLFGVIIVLSFIHGATAIAIAGLVWIGDLAVRYYFCGRSIHAEIVALPADVIRIRFNKTFLYSPGQYCFISIPALSVYQYHPFSISTAPHEEDIKFHIRVLGDWTRKLQKLAVDANATLTTPLKMDINVEGPYGLSSIDLGNGVYTVYLMISGGIGITPTQSVFNHLVHLSKTSQSSNPDAAATTTSMRKCIFAWSVKDRAMISSISKDLESPTESLPLSFQPDLIIQPLLGKQDSLEKSSSSSNSPRAVAPSVNSTLPNNVLPDEVSTTATYSFADTDIASVEPFHLEFYLTSVRNAEQYQAANIDPDVQKYVRFGRPDLPKLFARVATFCASENIRRVAVITCGPGSMVDEVATLCRRRHEGIAFDLHKEVFDF